MANTADKSVFSELSRRGLVAQCSNEEALRSLLDEKKGVCYLGIDPTSDSLHVGNFLPVTLMMRLVKSGQKGIMLIGGGTACVGDPSGKTEMRKVMDRERIQHNASRIKAQLQALLARAGVDVLYLDNSEWLLSLGYVDFLRDVGRHFSVNRMLSFESYKARMERGLSFIEFNYQPLQAYDYYHLHRSQGCNLQIGGDDQWGNMVAGMDLIRRMSATDSEVLTVPLVTTAGGAKMGKTERGAVFLDAKKTPVFDFYQYWRNVDDRDVRKLLLYYTELPFEEVAALTASGGAALNRAKEVLALEVTRGVHGTEEAERAMQTAKSLFSGSDAGEALPSARISRERLAGAVPVVELFVESKLCSSASDARRLIAGGGARVHKRRILSHEERVGLDDVEEGKVVLQAGKKKFFCFKVEGDR